MTDSELEGVMAHEILHLALRHHTRRQSREAKRWNVAGDLVINQMLQEMNYELPSEGAFISQFGFPEDKTTDVYYDMLEERMPGHGEDVGELQARGILMEKPAPLKSLQEFKAPFSGGVK